MGGAPSPAGTQEIISPQADAGCHCQRAFEIPLQLSREIQHTHPLGCWHSRLSTEPSVWLYVWRAGTLEVNPA